MPDLLCPCLANARATRAGSTGDRVEWAIGIAKRSRVFAGALSPARGVAHAVKRMCHSQNGVPHALSTAEVRHEALGDGSPEYCERDRNPRVIVQLEVRRIERPEHAGNPIAAIVVADSAADSIAGRKLVAVAATLSVAA